MEGGVEVKVRTGVMVEARDRNEREMKRGRMYRKNRKRYRKGGEERRNFERERGRVNRSKLTSVLEAHA